MSKRFATLAALSVVAACGLGAAQPTHAATPSAPCATSMSLQALACSINQARAQHGLPPIRARAILTRSSSIRASAIVRCRQFSHTPCGQPFVAPFNAVGYRRSGSRIGETLAWASGSAVTPARVVSMWLASPGHRRVLLARGWRDLGGVAVAAQGLFGQPVVTVWVAQFGRR